MVRTIRARSVLLFCVLLFGLSAVANAGGGSTVVNKVRVTATSDWANGQLKGYQPVRLELVNESADPRQVTIELESSYNNGDRVTQRFGLGPRARITAEVVVPTFALDDLNRWNREWSLQARSGGDTEYIGSVCGAGGQSAKSVMVFTQDRLNPGEREAWAGQLAEQLSEGEQTLQGMRQATTGQVAAVGQELVSVFDLGASLHEHMPSKHEAYSSLDCVIVDLSKGVPSFEKLEPLLSYVRLGGNVAWLGVGAAEKAAQHELIAPWMESRFAVIQSGIDAKRFSVFACGFGAMLVGDTTEELLARPETQESLRVLMMSRVSFVPNANRSRPILSLSIPGVEKLPYKIFVGLLILFAIVIGPINFILVRKSGKPVLLLLTIPAISLLATVLLLSYGVLYQGLDTKSSSVTIACLDQRSERVNVVEDRHTFVGLATEPGLRPAAGTACFPVRDSNPDARFAIAVGESNVLSASFFQSRQDMHQRFLSDRSSRLRLVLEKNAEGLSVTNGFTCGVSGLLLRDEQQRYWRHSGELAQGETAQLELISESAKGAGQFAESRRVLGIRDLQVSRVLNAGSYFAVLDENIFQDPCGLDLNELGGRHGVLGTLDLGDFR